MGHKFSKIIGEALKGHYDPQAPIHPQPATCSVSASRDGDTDSWITTESDQVPGTDCVKPPDAIPFEAAAEPSVTEVMKARSPLDTSRSPESPHQAASNLVNHSSSCPSESTYGGSNGTDMSDAGTAKAQELEKCSALAGRIMQLHLELFDMTSKADREAMIHAVLQLCECDSTTCRAAFRFIAITEANCRNYMEEIHVLKQKLDQAEAETLAALQESTEHLRQGKALADKLNALYDEIADPHNEKYLRYKVKRLEQENAEIPKVRSQLKDSQKEHTELLQLRTTVASLQDKADTADELSDRLTKVRTAHVNMKEENKSLKKNVNVAKALEVKDELHQANSKIEELQQVIKTLESKTATGSGVSGADVSRDKVVIKPNDPDNNMGLKKFQISSKFFNAEAIRALDYINKLNGTVVKRAATISGERAGMGWDAFHKLEELMEWVSEEGREAAEKITSMERAKEGKVGGFGISGAAEGEGKAGRRW